MSLKLLSFIVDVLVKMFLKKKTKINTFMYYQPVSPDHFPSNFPSNFPSDFLHNLIQHGSEFISINNIVVIFVKFVEIVSYLFELFSQMRWHSFHEPVELCFRQTYSRKNRENVNFILLECAILYWERGGLHGTYCSPSFENLHG